MKLLSESTALARLEKIKTAYRYVIKEKYESRAKSCLTCETQGACCLDEHFVNVHISRLEAAAIHRRIEDLTADKQHEIYSRISEAVVKYKLTEAENTFAQTFACPLFEKGVGCLIHEVKPVPCIQHSCYERREDLPPDELQIEIEAEIENFNKRTYRKEATWLPLPLGLMNSLKNKID